MVFFSCSSVAGNFTNNDPETSYLETCMECFGPAMNRQLGPGHLGEAPAAPRPTSAGGAVIETEGRNVLMGEKEKNE